MKQSRSCNLTLQTVNTVVMTCAFFLPALQLESFQVNTSRLEAVFCSVLKFILSLFRVIDEIIHFLKSRLTSWQALQLSVNSHIFISRWQLHTCIVEVNFSIWEFFAVFSSDGMADSWEYWGLN